MRLHIDTDFAGNPDDACAVAMVLGWPGVEITAITTTADPDGRRAGFLRHLLDIAGRNDVPVASGAGMSGTTRAPMGDLPDADRYWGGPVDPLPSPPGAALDLLASSLDCGATVAAIGPLTNLADLERTTPGRLGGARVVVMGGWTQPLDPDLPDWGPERDWNVQCDTDAARTVLELADVTWVPVAVTARTHLRRSQLPRLVAAGSLGQLLARQAQEHAADRKVRELARRSAGLPDDLLNFHHDPLACATALGWTGVRMQHVVLEPRLEGGVLRLEMGGHGFRCRLVTGVDAAAFTESWLSSVERASRRA